MEKEAEFTQAVRKQIFGLLTNTWPYIGAGLMMWQNVVEAHTKEIRLKNL